MSQRNGQPDHQLYTTDPSVAGTSWKYGLGLSHSVHDHNLYHLKDSLPAWRRPAFISSSAERPFNSKAFPEGGLDAIHSMCVGYYGALCVRSTHRGPCSLMVHPENTVAPFWPTCLVSFPWKRWHWSRSEDWCTHKSLCKPHGPDLSGHAFACPNLNIAWIHFYSEQPFQKVSLSPSQIIHSRQHGDLQNVIQAFLCIQCSYILPIW